MIFRLVLRSLKRSKARFICAISGIAVASLAIAFVSSLVATNSAQAPILASRAAKPWVAWCFDGPKAGRTAMGARPSPAAAKKGRSSPTAAHFPKADFEIDAIALSIDYRPLGHVLQGPPMRALLAPAPKENLYASLALVEGRWVDEASGEREVVCVKKAMQRFGAAPPKLGEELKFVGAKGTMSAKIVGYLDGESKLPREFPNVFASSVAWAALAGEEKSRLYLYREIPQDGVEGLLSPSSDEVQVYYKGDEQKRMDFATPLLIIAALLTALSLLVNSLLLSVESNRKSLALLRTAGMTKSLVVKFVFLESLLEGYCGWAIGTILGLASLYIWVATGGASFPAGLAIDFKAIGVTFLLVPVLVFVAVLFALRSALKVRALDILGAPRAHRIRGMIVTYSLGFAAFVAVEVWGSSLMRSFIPSPEWPDAIVSILPSGVSSFEIEKLRDVEGVRKISELLPLQLYLANEGDGESARPWRPNILFLASEWLPDFRFIEGDHEDAARQIRENGAVVISEMTSRAHNLHKGDALEVEIGRGENRSVASLPIAGVVDLNWHMVTSRGLVRGLNRMPVMTDGPAFVSFDTLESLDFRPAFMVQMTHLWVEYDKDFLSRHGVFESGRLVEAEIARRLGYPSGSTIRLHARDEIADGTLAHGSDLIGEAARVPFFFLAILSIGFIAMLVGLVESKKEELLLLRSVGATRFQLVLRLVKTAALAALAGAAIGFPLGAFAGWKASIATAAKWPGLPHWFIVPYPVIIEGAAFSLLFALAFAIPSSVSLVSSLARRK